MLGAPDRFGDVKRYFGAAALLELAKAEGLHHRGSGRNRSECPGCRNGDPRGVSIGERDGCGVWKCQRDEQHRGTAIDFLALAHSTTSLEALAELERIAGIDSRAPHRPAPPPRKLAPPPAYPPAVEVADLWNRCAPLGLVPEVASAWAARGIPIAHVEDRDLARAIPSGIAVPRWAFGAGQRWSAGAHRLLVPLYDSAGRLASLHARAAVAPAGKPKGLSPLGCALSGLIMADPLARLMLAGTACADGEASAEVVRRCDLVVTEGVPDFLTWAAMFGDAAENAPAIVGMIAGSWTAEIAARVPDGTGVYVRQHADAAGAKYTAHLIETLAGRCSVSVTTVAEGGAR